MLGLLTVIFLGTQLLLPMNLGVGESTELKFKTTTSSYEDTMSVGVLPPIYVYAERTADISTELSGYKLSRDRFQLFSGGLFKYAVLGVIIVFAFAMGLIILSKLELLHEPLTHREKKEDTPLAHWVKEWKKKKLGSLQ